MNEFPVDDNTLDILWQSLHPEEVDPDATQTKLWDCLILASAGVAT